MKTKATYDWIDFVRPDGYWPYPYTIDQAFGVFAWMMKTGSHTKHSTTWGMQGVYELLSCKSSCVNFHSVDPIISLDDLRKRFHYAILGKAGSSVQLWRQKYGILIGKRRQIHFPHFSYECDRAKSEHDIKVGLDCLLGSTGRLGVQLNKYHSRAREAYGVKIHWRGVYLFELNYGYQGSVWRHTLSRQLPSETFTTAAARAGRKLAELMNEEKQTKQT